MNTFAEIYFSEMAIRTSVLSGYQNSKKCASCDIFFEGVCFGVFIIRRSVLHVIFFSKECALAVSKLEGMYFRRSVVSKECGLI